MSSGVGTYLLLFDVNHISDLKGRGTYYIPGPALLTATQKVSGLSEQDFEQRSNGGGESESLVDIPEVNTILVEEAHEISEKQIGQLKFPEILKEKLDSLGRRAKSKDLEELIIELCSHYALPLKAISILLKRHPVYLQTTFLKPLTDEGRLIYAFPEMLNHPRQAYWAKVKK